MSSTISSPTAMSTFVYDAAYRASIVTLYPPPPGVKANFDGPNSYGILYIVFAIFGLFLSTTFTAMRLYTKAVLINALGWDDYTCAVSVAFQYFWTGTTVKMALLGMGLKPWNVRQTVAAYEDYYLMSFISISVRPWVLGLVKVSILLLYLRTFTEEGNFRYTLYTVLILTVVTHAAANPVYWFYVLPLDCEWKYAAVPDDFYEKVCHRRYNALSYGVFLAIFTVFLDIVVIILPSRAVWKLRTLGKEQKIPVILLLMAGGIVTLASTLRFVFFYENIYVKGASNTFADFQVNVCGNLELNLAIICCCIPTFRTFLRRMLPPSLHTASGTRSKKASIICPTTLRPSPTDQQQPRQPDEERQIPYGGYLELGAGKGDRSFAMTTNSVESRSTVPGQSP